VADTLQNKFKVGFDIGSGDPKDAKTARLERIVTFSIGLNLIVMHRAIDLDHELGLMTIEVSNEAVDDLLPTELHAQSPATEHVPQYRFGIRWIVAKLAALSLLSRIDYLFRDQARRASTPLKFSVCPDLLIGTFHSYQNYPLSL
jgi:hypothetical protein